MRNWSPSLKAVAPVEKELKSPVVVGIAMPPACNRLMYNRNIVNLRSTKAMRGKCEKEIWGPKYDPNRVIFFVVFDFQKGDKKTYFNG